ncbi:MAG: phytanoyl-CoA dioxygenase family protein [Alphaproteobacteria bacterium]|nr:phytanoyl-CoA dioxygenase family protein [Alphaproteobacteria bacterium]
MNRRPLTSITDADRVAYARDGIVCLRRQFDADWMTVMGRAVDAAMVAPGPHGEEYTPAGGRGRFFGDLDVWRRHEPFRRFVFQSPAAEIAGRIMGSDTATFFYDQLLVKEPGTAERTPWHQDQPYWAVSGRQVCSVWVPFDPVAEDACVEYVAGSHAWPEFSPYHFADGRPYAGTGLPTLPDIEAERDRHRILRFALEPGDCLVFQAMIVHGAPGNASQRRRRALATRWTGDDARYCVRPGEVAIPTSDPGLAHGDRLAGEMFPLIWRAGAV